MCHDGRLASGPIRLCPLCLIWLLSGGQRQLVCGRLRQQCPLRHLCGIPSRQVWPEELRSAWDLEPKLSPGVRPCIASFISRRELSHKPCIHGLRSCLTKHFKSFWMLMLGRITGGIATSLLFSVPLGQGSRPVLCPERFGSIGCNIMRAETDETHCRPPP